MIQFGREENREEDNLFFGDDNFVENLSQKKLTKLPVLHIILAVRKGKRFYIHLIAKSDR